ncbi:MULTISPECIES: hypothetical protein [Saliphagus]|uniref:Uncharacterized protein n=1 Tax=Saliphagus infecundisoli TaxID=1849069 RepID=A0ABD5QEP8_9EURY|nr:MULTISPECIES: hypothetical protein [Saliphagus]
MAEIYLLSTVLMTVILIAVAVAIARSGHRATPSGQSGGRSGFAEWSGRVDPDRPRIVELAYDPMAWTVSFVVLAIVFIAGAVVMVQGLSGIGGAVGTGLLAVGGAILGGFLFFGAFFAARDRIGYTAAGIAVAAVTTGLIALLGIVVMLLQA